MRDIAARACTRRFGRGDAIVKQGKRSNALFVMVSGRARVLTADRRHKEVTLAVLHPGSFVGEMSLIDDQAHSATVEAMIETDMVVIDGADFARLMPERGSMAHGVMVGLVQRLRSANRQIESLALLDVYGRVARTLLDMSEESGSARIVRKKVSRQDLAKVVGASREMVSRVLSELSRQGLVEAQEGGTLLLSKDLT